ncbi:MAG: PKD domain-containing protein, partial [Owenweeksia sp.]
TSYDFYVVDICAGDTSAPVGPVSFTTATGPLNANFTFTPGTPSPGACPILFNATSSAGATTYAWNFGDGSNGTGSTTSHSYTANGTYQVTLTITGPCGTDVHQDSVVVGCIGLAENMITQSLSIYPNPTSGRIQVSFETASSDGANITILDLSGKAVLRFDVTDLNGRFDDYLDISELANGTYMLRVESGSMTAVRRIVKQ